jgi:hypothetical protein
MPDSKVHVIDDDQVTSKLHGASIASKRSS